MFTTATSIEFSKTMNRMHFLLLDWFTLFFLSVTKMVTQFAQLCTNMYEDYGTVRNVVDYSVYFTRFTYSKLISKKIEPMTSYWICTSVLSKRDKNRYLGDEYTILDSYEYVQRMERTEGTERKERKEDSMDDLVSLKLYATVFNEQCDAVDSIVLNDQRYIQGQVKMKIGDTYVCRAFDNTSGFFEKFQFPMIPSNCRFLSIEYTHPIMEKGIVVNLDRSIYIVGNQILSPVFMKSYLEYQSELFFFDKDYKIKIMDNKIQLFEIGFNHSIVLKEDTYEIIERQ